MLDMQLIEEIRVLDKKEAKDKLDEYASQFGIKLKKTKSFENMLADLETEFKALSDEPLPEDNVGISISDLIDDEKEELPELVQLEDSPEAVITVVEVDKAPEDAIRIPETATVEEITKIIEDNAVVIESEKFELPDNFSPTLIKMGPGAGYCTLPWWIYEWITQNPDWKEKPNQFPHHYGMDTLYSLIYYIKREGQVRIRETRNSRFFVLN